MIDSASQREFEEWNIPDAMRCLCADQWLVGFVSGDQTSWLLYFLKCLCLGLYDKIYRQLSSDFFELKNWFLGKMIWSGKNLCNKMYLCLFYNLEGLYRNLPLELPLFTKESSTRGRCKKSFEDYFIETLGCL